MIFKLFLNPTPSGHGVEPAADGLLLRRYREQVAQRHIRRDDAQIRALGHCQALLDALQAHHDVSRQARWFKWNRYADNIQSLYLYGGVGRGKSMLIDWLYEACPFAEKRRVHFHTFMQEVHAYTHRCRQEKRSDAIESFAREIGATTRLLCFDEFHVTDVADAMILGRLFSLLFELGVVFVITSNRHPDDLYKGGLQREQFLPFVARLQDEADVVHLDTNEDFRLGHFKALKTVYHSPLGAEADQFIHHSYLELTNYAELTPATVSVLGRTLSLTAAHGDVALSSFDELCARPLGAADYLVLADEFSTLIVSDIPKLSPAQRNEAKRFVTLIDTLYEHKVKLICSAAVPVHQLYTEGDGAFEFARTISRLVEMQSEAYWSLEHR